MNLKEFLSRPTDPVFDCHPEIVCNNGTMVSIQNGKNHYAGKNTVEIDFNPSNPIPEDLGGADIGQMEHGVYGWVSIEEAEKMIEHFGGINVEKTLEEC